MTNMSEVFRKSVLIAALAIGAALIVAAHGSLAQNGLMNPSAVAMPQTFSHG